MKRLIRSFSSGLFRLGAIGCLLLAAGCLPRPAVVSPPLQFKSVEALLLQLDTVSGRFQSVRGEARMKVSTAEQTFSVTQVVLAERPNRLRAEALSPFGTSMLVLAADDQALAAYLPTQGDFYQGESTPANIARFTQLPLRLEDLVGVLLYHVPRFPFEHASLVLDGEGTLLELGNEGAVVQRFGFNAAGELTRATYLVDGQVRLQVAYSDFSDFNPRFPRSIQLSIPDRKIDVSIRFSEVDTNVAIPLERFHLAPPPGIEAQPLP